jgi:carbon-monoxide dehydrogenase large subunit
MPFRTGLDYTYDSGDFPQNMALALKAAYWAGFEARRAEAKARGKLRGIGIANAIESAGGPHRGPMEEAAEIRFDSGGSMTLLMGSHNHGQGHETVFRQIASERLGIPAERIRFINGDTDIVTHGRGTIGSRSMMAAGGALVGAAERIIARGKKIAAHFLEAAEADIEFSEGQFRIAGTDRGIGIEALARRSYIPGQLPLQEELGLSALLIRRPGDATFPNGCHIAEVEIDLDTGEVAIPLYVSSNDAGRVVNPLIVEGQVVGGALQGIGQALCEAVIYDPSTGQPLTASFMDYTLPRADMLPTATTLLDQSIPCRTNPLGVKGVGELGTIGATPALVNAVADALARHGRGAVADSVQMPLTPPRIWALLQG